MKIKYIFSELTKAINNSLLKQQKTQEIRLDRLSMDPHRYWIAIGKGMERPFIGEFNDHFLNGVYSCYHCKNKLFTSDSKYNAMTGLASFFQHYKNSIKIAQSNKKYVFFNIILLQSAIQCNNCKSYIGQISKDGPPPTFLRYSINSSALIFHKQKTNQIKQDIIQN